MYAYEPEYLWLPGQSTQINRGGVLQNALDTFWSPWLDTLQYFEVHDLTHFALDTLQWHILKSLALARKPTSPHYFLIG